MSEAFACRDGTLFAEDVALEDIAARFGTPAYVYSRAAIEARFDAFESALAGAHAHLVCYAVKANSNLAVLNVLARRGAGFDIVSGGELRRVLLAGGDPRRIVFSGVAKSREDIVAALEAGILCFNVESAAELARLQEIAAATGRTAAVSIRVNPDVDAQSHPYISTGLRENKFGVAIEAARTLYAHAATLPNLRITGIDCHIGSQLTTLGPFVDALDRVLAMVDELARDGIELSHIDTGGGLGVVYRDEAPPSPQEYAAALLERFGRRRLTLITEPGRAIVARAGVLLTRVEYLKDNGERRFAIVDAGMNDLIRPSLYGAWMGIEPVRPRSDIEPACYDVVGPVCESGDFLGKQRTLALAGGELLAVTGAGAYGFAMSSNYNSRPRAAEIMVDGSNAFLVRERESLEDLVRGERLLPQDR
ncbi:MAG: Diaminopimelate decarboxylase [Pseudomonadales bacterium]|nr:Diaminopimelate decarboxylase [Pseudomonadales bacterium]